VTFRILAVLMGLALAGLIGVVVLYLRDYRLSDWLPDENGWPAA
jgi:VanZ family protein